MAMNDKPTNERKPGFSFGVRELEQAERKAASEALTLESAPRKTDVKSQGFDPYNTSGSFDRRKNWSRVGKR